MNTRVVIIKDLNLDFVSSELFLFSHTFKEYTGSNFVDYVNEAKKLLKEPDYKVFEVAEMLGYMNPKQFARVFHQKNSVVINNFQRMR
jgi:two-component system, response regulator YesN